MATIGIDFGASRLRVAVDRQGTPTPVNHPYAGQRMPFVVGLDDQASPENPLCRISSLKRMLDFDKALPVPPSGMNSLDCLAGMLQAVREQCLASTRAEDVNCVAAVAPCFSQRQRSALRAAARKAGFSRVKLVDEPLAVLLASRERIAGSTSVFVYSLGASTFSASLYRATGKIFELVAQDGDRHLGGDDIDSVVAAAVLEEIPQVVPDVLAGKGANVLWAIARATQRASRLLAAGKSVEMPLHELLGETGTQKIGEQAIRIPSQTHRTALSAMIGETLERCEKLLSEHDQAEPGVVVLSGGMARLPLVRDALTGRFGIPCESAEDSAAAVGAVLYGLSVKGTAWEEADARTSRGAPRPPAPSPPRPPKRWAETYAALLEAAQSQDTEGQTPQAIRTLDEVLAELGRLRGELCRKAATREKAAGRAEEALGLLREAHQFDPANRFVAVDFARACYEHGLGHHTRKDHAAAIRTLAEGIGAIEELQQDRREYTALLARLLHLKGCSLADVGRLAQAEKALAQSVDLHGEEPTYAESLKRIRAGLKQTPPKAAPPGRPRGADRNKPCPCGSGRKWKNCCGR